MNFKTTAVMLILLGVLLGGVYFIRLQESKRPKTVSEPPKPPMELAATPLFDPPLGDVVKLVCSQRGEPDWVFEKTVEADGPGVWRLTAPFEAEVPQWEATGIVNRLKDLKYQIAYGADEQAAVSLDEAGLQRPKFTVELFEESGTQHKVRIGRPASNSTHYVGAGDLEDVFVVQGSLTNLLKQNIYEYRERAMLSFDASKAVSVEFNVLEDAENDLRTTYRLVKAGGDWQFEEPLVDDAVDKPVMDALAAMSNLRASAWVAADASDVFARYGLAPPKVDIEVTCEETVTIDGEPGGDDADAASSEPLTETVLKQYRLYIATRSPLGDSNLVYAKLDTDGGVATITKNIADKMTPAMETWRDMSVVQTDVADVERLTITAREGGMATLVRNEVGSWVFERSGESADTSSVRELVTTMSELDAFAYVHHANPKNPEFGLINPAARIEMKVAGSDDVAIVKVGNPTDPAGKRAYYLQRGDSEEVAKIRSGQAEVLLREPIRYRDRTVMQLAVSEIQEIRLDRLRSDSSDYVTTTVVNNAGTWRLTAPFADDADMTAAATMAAKLADLRAVSMVPESDRDAKAAFAKPAVIASMTHAKPPVLHLDSEGESVTSSVGSEVVAIKIGEHGGRVFAKRDDKAAMYEVSKGVLEAAMADLHDKSVWSFEMSQVKRVTVAVDGVSHGFERGQTGWYYAPEPALPIDGKKVDNLVLQLGDLKLRRYVAYGVKGLQKYGLDKPDRSVTISTDEGKTLELMVSRKVDASDAERSVFAAIKGVPHVFLMTPNTVSRIAVNMDEYETDGGT